MKELRKIRRCLDLYGTNINNWPDKIRAVFEHDFQKSEILQQWVMDEQLIEQGLISQITPDPSSSFLQSLEAIPHKNPRSAKLTYFLVTLQSMWRDAAFMNPVAQLVTMTVFGIIMGMYLTSNIDSIEHGISLQSSTYPLLYEGLFYQRTRLL